MSVKPLHTPTQIGALSLKNHLVMAPMTRCRAIGNVPNDLMALYYQQRSGAGLIITEGVSPSPNGLGYARMPGIFSKEQVEGWKKVADAVHSAGSKIFVQIMHSGRIGHPLNMPEGSELLGPSAVQAAGQMWTDAQQMQDHPVPVAMDAEKIAHTKAEFVQAARNAMEAGFDGVELHGANGYLLEQFLNPFSNVRTDEYGGSIENRCRFVLEVTEAVAEAIGKEKTGIRMSPYGAASDMAHYPEVDATYDYLSKELNKIGIAYIHLVDHSAMGAPEVPSDIKETIRRNFKNTMIHCGGFSEDTAEAAIAGGHSDLIAFGRPWINNPDLADRLANNWPLSQVFHGDLLYSAEALGYTDYPDYKA